jgi:mono/diheme cytochrome c family protein
MEPHPKMFEPLYTFLREMGYAHPLHAPTTHLPLGMMVGAFIFALLARLLGKTSLVATSRHCATLAFISVFPTAAFGVMDWLHFYGGAWLFPIRMKILLASTLAVVLLICLLLERRAHVMRRTLLLFLALGVLTSAGLGYFGGELVFSLHKPPEAQVPEPNRQGAEAFARACASCHPNGENPFKPGLAPKTAPQLTDFETFLSYIRNPKARDGSNTIMPPFSADRLSEAEVRAIYLYLSRDLKGS